MRSQCGGLKGRAPFSPLHPWAATNLDEAVTYKLTKVTAKKKLLKQAKKRIRVAADGKITLKKGLKKGAYKLTVPVTAAGNEGYESATKAVAVKIMVK